VIGSSDLIPGGMTGFLLRLALTLSLFVMVIAIRLLDLRQLLGLLRERGSVAAAAQ